MALVPCPDCGHEISELAPACIHCGRPMQAAAPPSSARAADQPHAAGITAAPVGDAPPPAWSRRARELAAAAPANLPKPVAGIATVLVIGGGGLVWSMIPAHPKDPASVAAEYGVVSTAIDMLGNSAVIIGALMAAMDHRTGNRVVRVSSWVMIAAVLLLVLVGWVLIKDSSEATRNAPAAGMALVFGLAAAAASAPWLLFIYLFRKSRYG